MIKTIDECFFQIQNGANIKQGDVDGGFPITRIETTVNDKFNRDRMGYAGITDISKYESYVLEEGDLLMSHINSVQYLGRTVLYVKEADETIIHGMNLLRLKARRDVINPAYARYCFYGHSFRSKVGNITKKSVNQASFAVKDLKQIKIEVPSLSEQDQIVKVLDKLQNLIAMRNDELSALDELIKARFIELFGDYINEGGKPLSELATITGGLTKNSKRNAFNLKMPYLRVANVFFNRLDLNEILEIGVREDEIGKTLLQTGDLLFVEGNGSIEQIGRVAIWDGSISPILHQNHLIKARFHKKTIFPEFALFYFMSQEGRQQIISKSVSTSGLNTLSVNKISSLILPMPPIELQKQFAAFVAQTDKSKVAVQKY